MIVFALPLLAAAAAGAPAIPTAAASRPTLAAPSAERLKTDVTTMVGFGTRHTASTTTDPRRGIGAARNWAAARFAAIGRTCGGCIRVERIERSFTGPRAPGGVVVQDVLGIQPGRDPSRVVIIGAHIDSRVTDVMDT